MGRFTSNPFVKYPPPVNRKELRKEIKRLDIKREASLLAMSNQPPDGETEPSAIEASINGVFEAARGDATQTTIGRIGEVNVRAGNLDLAGDEADYALPVEGLSGDLAKLAADAGLEIPPLAQEQANAEQAKRAFLSIHGIVGDPSFEPSILRWVGSGLLVTFAEALLTAWIYIPTMGEPGGIVAAGLVGIAITGAGVIMACGILLAKHRRNRIASLMGPVVALVGVAFFIFVALCAAHLRLFLTANMQSNASEALEIVWNAVRISMEVASSLRSHPQLPLTDPVNLGFFTVAGLTLSGFVYQTNRTWSYWGFRPVALRLHRAVINLKRRTRNITSRMEDVGELSEREIRRQVDRLKQKDRDARGLMNMFMAIITAHSTAMAIIAAEHQRALATLREAYRATLAQGRPFPAGFARFSVGTNTGTEVAIPSDFDTKIKELQKNIYEIMSKRAQAQAQVDTKVSEAITALTRFVARELAKAKGVEYQDDDSPKSTSDSPEGPAIEGDVV